MMMTLLANADLNAVPSELLKNLLIIALVLSNVIIPLWIASHKSQTVISPQPLTVEIVKALHEQFADKQEFENHVEHNTERHGQLFNNINRVEREARESMERKFTSLNDERRATVEKLDAQFVFIRENIAAINRELQIRNR